MNPNKRFLVTLGTVMAFYLAIGIAAVMIGYAQ